MALAIVPFGQLATMPTGNARGIVEEVYVGETSTNDDRAIIVRSNGEAYLVEKGNGCSSLWRYEGSRVLLLYPATFSGFGLRLLIPQAHQQCGIWVMMQAKRWNTSPWLSIGTIGDWAPP
jgi:hypothetical protein